MITSKLIVDIVPPVQITDTAEKAMEVMREHQASQLPVLEGEKYIGIILSDELRLVKNKKKTLNQLDWIPARPFVLQTAHLFDIMRVAAEFNASAVPVVDEEFNYHGMIPVQSCLHAFASYNSIAAPGAVLELETDTKNYSLSKLAGIAEDNDAPVLCFYTNINQQKLHVEITIKVNTTDVSAFVASLERHEYQVRNIYNETEYTEALKTRYDSLMRYLNV